jgi:hypothetical protein
MAEWIYRVDFIPSAKDTFNVRYLHDRANFNPDLQLNTSGLPGFDADVGGPSQPTTMARTWTMRRMCLEPLQRLPPILRRICPATDWDRTWDRRSGTTATTYRSATRGHLPGSIPITERQICCTSAFTRHISISGTTQLQSGYHSTFNVSGLDTNGDGSAANDRPLVGNAHKPIDTAAFDGSYVGGTPGVYYDIITGNPTTADNVHWLVPNGPQFTTQEVGRNSFVNPNSQFWNIAVEKDVPSTWLHFERGMFVFRVEAQNFTNHNNIGPLDINLLDIGTSSYLNKQNGVEPTFRHLLLWAKFRF